MAAVRVQGFFVHLGVPWSKKQTISKIIQFGILVRAAVLLITNHYVSDVS